jgi:hypothetical protein
MGEPFLAIYSVELPATQKHAAGSCVRLNTFPHSIVRSKHVPRTIAEWWRAGQQGCRITGSPRKRRERDHRGCSFALRAHRQARTLALQSRTTPGLELINAFGVHFHCLDKFWITQVCPCQRKAARQVARRLLWCICATGYGQTIETTVPVPAWPGSGP